MPNEAQQVPTKEVYVYGNVYYDAMESDEIRVFFDHDITFTVPAEMDIDIPNKELHELVMANAVSRVRGRLDWSDDYQWQSDLRWDADYVVHNVGH